ncbi:uncharacterized protein MONBRDRAFT_10420 [Monosiga brevicollis MX1]|uniref:HECT domain-containing protein n=1 Tax=Monosiga brevicollis TaxID=81824 RepID=A9V658_MONBE|nr:uncharacterized protein MONBRDRAFT_10420 [Monosiga brevicollis MX1]EDQ86933.1 predicted protein [Monosiga brevicollis MX1]|eukprot:XP_001748172.1 hypothetical protein [Monosiga brevicollis MX1]
MPNPLPLTQAFQKAQEDSAAESSDTMKPEGVEALLLFLLSHVLDTMPVANKPQPCAVCKEPSLLESKGSRVYQPMREADERQLEAADQFMMAELQQMCRGRVVQASLSGTVDEARIDIDLLLTHLGHGAESLDSELVEALFQAHERKADLMAELEESIANYYCPGHHHMRIVNEPYSTFREQLSWCCDLCGCSGRGLVAHCEPCQHDVCLSCLEREEDFEISGQVSIRLKSQAEQRPEEHETSSPDQTALLTHFLPAFESTFARRLEDLKPLEEVQIPLDVFKPITRADLRRACDAAGFIGAIRLECCLRRPAAHNALQALENQLFLASLAVFRALVLPSKQQVAGFPKALAVLRDLQTACAQELGSVHLLTEALVAGLSATVYAAIHDVQSFDTRAQLQQQALQALTGDDAPGPGARGARVRQHSERASSPWLGRLGTLLGGAWSAPPANEPEPDKQPARRDTTISPIPPPDLSVSPPAPVFWETSPQLGSDDQARKLCFALTSLQQPSDLIVLQDGEAGARLELKGVEDFSSLGSLDLIINCIFHPGSSPALASPLTLPWRLHRWEPFVLPLPDVKAFSVTVGSSEALLPLAAATVCVTLLNCPSGYHLVTQQSIASRSPSPLPVGYVSQAFAIKSHTYSLFTLRLQRSSESAAMTQARIDEIRTDGRQRQYDCESRNETSLILDRDAVSISFTSFTRSEAELEGFAITVLPISLEPLPALAEESRHLQAQTPLAFALVALTASEPRLPAHVGALPSPLLTALIPGQCEHCHSEHSATRVMLLEVLAGAAHPMLQQLYTFVLTRGLQARNFHHCTTRLALRMVFVCAYVLGLTLADMQRALNTPHCLERRQLIACVETAFALQRHLVTTDPSLDAVDVPIDAESEVPASVPSASTYAAIVTGNSSASANDVQLSSDSRNASTQAKFASAQAEPKTLADTTQLLRAIVQTYCPCHNSEEDNEDIHEGVNDAVPQASASVNRDDNSNGSSNGRPPPLLTPGFSHMEARSHSVHGDASGSAARAAASAAAATASSVNQNFDLQLESCKVRGADTQGNGNASMPASPRRSRAAPRGLAPPRTSSTVLPRQETTECPERPPLQRSLTAPSAPLTDKAWRRVLKGKGSRALGRQFAATYRQQEVLTALLEACKGRLSGPELQAQLAAHRAAVVDASERMSFLYTMQNVLHPALFHTSHRAVLAIEQAERSVASASQEAISPSGAALPDASDAAIVMELIRVEIQNLRSLVLVHGSGTVTPALIDYVAARLVTIGAWLRRVDHPRQLCTVMHALQALQTKLDPLRFTERPIILLRRCVLIVLLRCLGRDSAGTGGEVVTIESHRQVLQAALETLAAPAPRTFVIEALVAILLCLGTPARGANTAVAQVLRTVGPSLLANTAPLVQVLGVHLLNAVHDSSGACLDILLDYALRPYVLVGVPNAQAHAAQLACLQIRRRLSTHEHALKLLEPRLLSCLSELEAVQAANSSKATPSTNNSSDLVSPQLQPTFVGHPLLQLDAGVTRLQGVCSYGSAERQLQWIHLTLGPCASNGLMTASWSSMGTLPLPNELSAITTAVAVGGETLYFYDAQWTRPTLALRQDTVVRTKSFQQGLCTSERPLPVDDDQHCRFVVYTGSDSDDSWAGNVSIGVLRVDPSSCLPAAPTIITDLSDVAVYLDGTSIKYQGSVVSSDYGIGRPLSTGMHVEVDVDPEGSVSFIIDGKPCGVALKNFVPSTATTPLYAIVDVYGQCQSARIAASHRSTAAPHSFAFAGRDELVQNCLRLTTRMRLETQPTQPTGDNDGITTLEGSKPAGPAGAVTPEPTRDTKTTEAELDPLPALRAWIRDAGVSSQSAPVLMLDRLPFRATLLQPALSAPPLGALHHDSILLPPRMVACELTHVPTKLDVAAEDDGDGSADSKNEGIGAPLPRLPFRHQLRETWLHVTRLVFAPDFAKLAMAEQAGLLGASWALAQTYDMHDLLPREDDDWVTAALERAVQPAPLRHLFATDLPTALQRLLEPTTTKHVRRFFGQDAPSRFAHLEFTTATEALEQYLRREGLHSDGPVCSCCDRAITLGPTFEVDVELRKLCSACAHMCTTPAEVAQGPAWWPAPGPSCQAEAGPMGCRAHHVDISDPASVARCTSATLTTSTILASTRSECVPPTTANGGGVPVTFWRFDLYRQDQGEVALSGVHGFVLDTESGEEDKLESVLMDVSVHQPRETTTNCPPRQLEVSVSAKVFSICLVIPSTYRLEYVALASDGPLAVQRVIGRQGLCFEHTDLWFAHDLSKHVGSNTVALLPRPALRHLRGFGRSMAKTAPVLPLSCHDELNHVPLDMVSFALADHQEYQRATHAAVQTLQIQLARLIALGWWKQQKGKLRCSAPTSAASSPARVEEKADGSPCPVDEPGSWPWTLAMLRLWGAQRLVPAANTAALAATSLSSEQLPVIRLSGEQLDDLASLLLAESQRVREVAGPTVATLITKDGDNQPHLLQGQVILPNASSLRLAVPHLCVDKCTLHLCDGTGLELACLSESLQSNAVWTVPGNEVRWFLRGSTEALQSARFQIRVARAWSQELVEDADILTANGINFGFLEAAQALLHQHCAVLSERALLDWAESCCLLAQLPWEGDQTLGPRQLAMLADVLPHIMAQLGPTIRCRLRAVLQRVQLRRHLEWNDFFGQVFAHNDCLYRVIDITTMLHTREDDASLNDFRDEGTDGGQEDPRLRLILKAERVDCDDSLDTGSEDTICVEMYPWRAAQELASHLDMLRLSSPALVRVLPFPLRAEEPDRDDDFFVDDADLRGQLLLPEEPEHGQSLNSHRAAKTWEGDRQTLSDLLRHLRARLFTFPFDGTIPGWHTLSTELTAIQASLESSHSATLAHAAMGGLEGSPAMNAVSSSAGRWVDIEETMTALRAQLHGLGEENADHKRVVVDHVRDLDAELNTTDTEDAIAIIAALLSGSHSGRSPWALAELLLTLEEQLEQAQCVREAHKTAPVVMLPLYRIAGAVGLRSMTVPFASQAEPFPHPADFARRSDYVAFVKARLRPGMRVQLLQDSEGVSAGDVGVFIQSNSRTPPVQCKWKQYGHTRWVHWHEIVLLPPTEVPGLSQTHDIGEATLKALSWSAHEETNSPQQGSELALSATTWDSQEPGLENLCDSARTRVEAVASSLLQGEAWSLFALLADVQLQPEQWQAVVFTARFDEAGRWAHAGPLTWIDLALRGGTILGAQLCMELLGMHDLMTTGDDLDLSTLIRVGAVDRALLAVMAHQSPEAQHDILRQLPQARRSALLGRAVELGAWRDSAVRLPPLMTRGLVPQLWDPMLQVMRVLDVMEALAEGSHPLTGVNLLHWALLPAVYQYHCIFAPSRRVDVQYGPFFTEKADAALLAWGDELAHALNPRDDEVAVPKPALLALDDVPAEEPAMSEMTCYQPSWCAQPSVSALLSELDALEAWCNEPSKVAVLHWHDHYDVSQVVALLRGMLARRYPLVVTCWPHALAGRVTELLNAGMTLVGPTIYELGVDAVLCPLPFLREGVRHILGALPLPSDHEAWLQAVAASSGDNQEVRITYEVPDHEHVLAGVDQSHLFPQMEPHSTNGFYCDICNRRSDSNEGRVCRRCISGCDYDLCSSCLAEETSKSTTQHTRLVRATEPSLYRPVRANGQDPAPALPATLDGLAHLPIQALRARYGTLRWAGDMIVAPHLKLLQFLQDPKLHRARAWISMPLKEELLKQHLTSTMRTEAEHGPTLRVDRLRAQSLEAWDVQSNRLRLPTLAEEARTVYAQIAEQLAVHVKEDARFLHLASKFWKIRLLGEGGDDYGGVYAESTTECLSELRDIKTRVLVPTPNGVADHGSQRDLLLINPDLRPFESEHDRTLLHFLGYLIGFSIRSGEPIDLPLAPCMWSMLLGTALTAEDVPEVDLSFARTLNQIRALPEDDDLLLACCLPTTMCTAGGRQVTVIEGLDVLDARNKQRFCDEALRIYLKQFDEVLTPVREALAKVLAHEHMLYMFTPAELETLVCGSQDVDLALLRANTRYEGLKETDDVVTWFWELLLPHYRSKKALRQKLVAAIENCRAIDADYNAADVDDDDSDEDDSYFTDEESGDENEFMWYV